MRKLVLDAEALVVESFVTLAEESARGTVAAQSYPRTGDTDCTICSEATCDAQCQTGHTCASLCWATYPHCQRTEYPVCIS